MAGPTAKRLADKLHHATVAVLVASTLYFGVEAFRATWYIQKHKAEQRVSWICEACLQAAGPHLQSSSSVGVFMDSSGTSVRKLAAAADCCVVLPQALHEQASSSNGSSQQ
jgi:hypothetical protein